jgi:uncharacterized protein
MGVRRNQPSAQVPSSATFQTLSKALPFSGDRLYIRWMPQILIDADACPVKDETYKVAWRYDVPVIVVSNSPIRIPAHPLISRVVVSDGFDAADDWIVEHVDAGSVVITADILLADRCLKAGCGAVIAPTGRPFTSASIGNAVATRAIMADLRAGAVGDSLGGPAPFAKADRSRFLSILDQTVVRLKR